MQTMQKGWQESGWSQSMAVAALGFLASVSFVSAAQEAASAPKTHVLFMGADLAIEHNSKLERVTDVVGTNLIVNIAGKRVEVRQTKEKALRINESLKIAESRVTIDELKVERGYTPENDPFNNFVNAAGAAAGQEAVQNLAEAKSAIAARDMLVGAPPPSPEQEAYLKGLETTAVFSGYESGYSQATNVGGHAGKFGMDQAQGLYDAIRGYFEVVPDTSMARPFYVLIAQFREKGSKPNTARKWVYAKSLDALEAGVRRKVYLLQGGFPPGYELESYNLHFYNDGEELATDVSKKRVEITADEALQFRIIEYIGANKNRTLPAVPSIARLSRAQRAQLVAGQLSETYYVRVTKDGNVAEVFHDAEGKQPLQDTQLESVIRSIRFMPALQTGKPIDAMAPLKLGALSDA